jgi:hypothetical protein
MMNAITDFMVQTSLPVPQIFADFFRNLAVACYACFYARQDLQRPFKRPHKSVRENKAAFSVTY